MPGECCILNPDFLSFLIPILEPPSYGSDMGTLDSNPERNQHKAARFSPMLRGFQAAGAVGCKGQRKRLQTPCSCWALFTVKGLGFCAAAGPYSL